MAFFFSYTLPYLVHSSFKGSCKYPVWAAVRASSAAPGYFDEFSLDNDIHHDGGILVNNATHIGRAIKRARVFEATFFLTYSLGHFLTFYPKFMF